MRWRRVSKYSIESECGGFRICRTGPPDALVYTAWVRRPWMAWDWCPIEYCRGPDGKRQAMRACEIEKQRQGANDDDGGRSDGDARAGTAG
jgi:hypothetical protein